MKNLFFSVCIILIVFGVSSLSWAEDSLSSHPLSLEAALRIAFVKNPKLAEAKKEISASKGKWAEAAALPDPELEIDIGGLKAQEKDQKVTRKGNLDAFTIKQPLDPIGTHLLKTSIAHDDVKIAEGELKSLWGEIRKNIIETYAGILAQEKAVETAKENLTITKTFYQKVEIKFQGGNVPRSDVLRAKIEVTRSENDLLISEKDLKVFRGTLNLLLGRDAETPLTLQDELTYSALKYQYDAICDAGLLARSDLRNEALHLRSDKKALWVAWLEAIFPKMSVGVQRSTQDFQNDTALILEASYPLWGFNFGKIKEAQAEKQKQEIHLDAAKKQIKLEIYQAFLEAELADRQVLLQKSALEEADDLLKQVTLKYEEAEVPFLTYLENIKTIKETKIAYYLALENYQQKVAELERVIEVTPRPQGVKQW